MNLPIPKAIIMFFIMSSMVYAQAKREDKIGIGADVLNSTNIVMKYYSNDMLAYEMTIGADLYKIGSDSLVNNFKKDGIEFNGGIAVLYHLSESEFSPYFGIEGVYYFKNRNGNLDNKESARNTVKGNFIFGGEYFIAKQFSIGIKEKICLGFGLPNNSHEGSDLRLNTNSYLTARFYFN